MWTTDNIFTILVQFLFKIICYQKLCIKFFFYTGMSSATKRLNAWFRDQRSTVRVAISGAARFPVDYLAGVGERQSSQNGNEQKRSYIVGYPHDVNFDLRLFRDQMVDQPDRSDQSAKEAIQANGMSRFDYELWTYSKYVQRTNDWCINFVCVCIPGATKTQKSWPWKSEKREF